MSTDGANETSTHGEETEEHRHSDVLVVAWVFVVIVVVGDDRRKVVVQCASHFGEGDANSEYELCFMMFTES